MTTTRIRLTRNQGAFFNSEAKAPALVAGLGSGKTYVLLLRMLNDILSAEGATVGCFLPTFDLLKVSIIPRIEEMLEQFQVRYRLDKNASIFHLGGGGRILCRSMDKPLRVISYELWRSYVDELDALRADQARDLMAFIRARTRQKNPAGPNRTYYSGTPEGRANFHHYWVKQPAPGRVLYHASTAENRHLPDDYVPDLLAQLSPAQAEAYLQGKMVSLFDGHRAFPEFDIDLNRCDTRENINMPMIIGCDFNVNHTSAVVWREMGDPYEEQRELHAVREFTGLRDTRHLVAELKRAYPEEFTRKTLSFYPDASGGARHTNDATSTDLSLLKDAGFRIKSGSRNPRVKERVLVTRGMILNANGRRRLKVNPDTCPALADAFESIGWDSVREGLEKSADAHDLSHIIDAGTYPVWWCSPGARSRLIIGKLEGFA